MDACVYLTRILDGIEAQVCHPGMKININHSNMAFMSNSHFRYLFELMTGPVCHNTRVEGGAHEATI